MIEKYKKIQRHGSDKLKLNYMNLEIEAEFEENKEKDWDRVEIRIQT
jgi:hypothetical protein